MNTRDPIACLAAALLICACNDEVDKTGPGGSAVKGSEEHEYNTRPEPPVNPPGGVPPAGAGDQAAGSTSGGSTSGPTAGGQGRPQDKQPEEKK